MYGHCGHKVIPDTSRIRLHEWPGEDRDIVITAQLLPCQAKEKVGLLKRSNRLPGGAQFLITSSPFPYSI